MSDPPADTEARIRAACETADFACATTLLVESYRKEIMSFLRMRLRGRAASEEVFSLFAEAIWKGLPGFQWRCPARTWAYTVARNAANRYAASPHEQAERKITLPSNIALEDADQARPTTQKHLRTTTKRRIRALRERLPAVDQELLVLRVDRGLSWRDLALAMSGDVMLDDESVERESARLRKSFERIKAQLMRMAEAEGLLSTERS